MKQFLAELSYAAGKPIVSIEDSALAGPAKDYATYVHKKLSELHERMKKNIVQAKQEAKDCYDKNNKAQIAKWRVGEEILLKEVRPDTKRHRILTHRRFELGPYYITDIVSNNTRGPAYKLVHVETGKSHRGLVNSDRLKPY